MRLIHGMTCVLCAFHPDNRHEPVAFVVNGTSVCEDHGIWMMRHAGGDSHVASHNFNIEVDDVDAWLETGVEYG